MGRIEDKIGRRYGRLVVVSLAGVNPVKWECRCDCGNVVAVVAGNLQSGNSKSCGCIYREAAGTMGRANATHGQSRHGSESREYVAWREAKARCSNEKHHAWRNYGGRGIVMCERWRESFEAFLSDMGACPAGLTLDRINNDGNYEPGNCRWATWSEQNLNKRRRGGAQ